MPHCVLVFGFLGVGLVVGFFCGIVADAISLELVEPLPIELDMEPLPELAPDPLENDVPVFGDAFASLLLAISDPPLVLPPCFAMTLFNQPGVDEP